MRITNFNVASSCTPSNTLIYGATYTISFTVTREHGDDFANALYVWLPTAGGEAMAYGDSAFSLAVGASKDISVTSRELRVDALEAALNTARAVPLTTWGVQFGNFGTRVDIAFAVNVVRGWLPHVTAFSANRSTGGVLSDEGESLLCDLKVSVSNYANTNQMFMRLHYDTDVVTEESAYIDITSEIEDAIYGISGSAALITRQFPNGSDWNLLLVFGDAYEYTFGHVSVPRAFANMHLSGCATGGVAFGKFSASALNAPRFECVYPATFYGGITNLQPVNLQRSVAASTSMANSGLALTIPANSCYCLTARAGYTARKPSAVIISTSADSANSGAIADALVGTRVATASVAGYTAQQITLYVWAKWSGSGSESVYLDGFIFTMSASAT